MSRDSLFAAQTVAGAVFAQDESDVPRAISFGDPRAEYEAAVHAAALFDVSDRTQIELTGEDRAVFLHNFCTNNIGSLAPGQGGEAFVTNVKGRVLGHIFVFVGEESIWVESVSGAEESLLTHLSRYVITEDVQLHRRTSTHGELFLTGPRAAEQLRNLDMPADSLDPHDHVGIARNGFHLAVRRADWLGQPGFLLCTPRDNLADLWQQLSAGDVQPAGTAAFHALRIEAGMPLYGVDISDDNLAQEVARTKQAISFTKGCYLGQEPIARLDTLGHVNRELRSLRLAADPLPAPGCSVLAGDDATEIGKVTSAAVSYRDDLPVALAYLRRGFVDPGTEVRVQVDDVAVPAAVFWFAAD